MKENNIFAATQMNTFGRRVFNFFGYWLKLFDSSGIDFLEKLKLRYRYFNPFELQSRNMSHTSHYFPATNILRVHENSNFPIHFQVLSEIISI